MAEPAPAPAPTGRYNGTDIDGLPWHAATEAALRLHLSLRAAAVRRRTGRDPDLDLDPVIWLGPPQGRAVEKSTVP